MRRGSKESTLPREHCYCSLQFLTQTPPFRNGPHSRNRVLGRKGKSSSSREDLKKSGGREDGSKESDWEALL